MPKKVAATKTINPLHFEDLEPHRFEDLVRRLLYGFREWTTIEATGRGGADDGFDIRAWEGDKAITNVSEDGEIGIRALDGRLWQIQGKREKSINPGKMRAIIREGVDKAHPPYGYILAAATNISKKTYDIFRDELRKMGIVELYFWGKDHLEDQLALPQHDEILFTFFGLSLSPRRKSKVAEIKFIINNKNKLLKLIFGTGPIVDGHVPRGNHFLLRDIKADGYPWRQQYPDFDAHRRWEEHEVAEVTPEGILFKCRERYAYYDASTKQWDVSNIIDLIHRKHNLDESNAARFKDEGKHAEYFWRHLPRRVQAKLLVYGFVRFDEILIIDEKGDTEFTDPHLFIDFSSHGPWHGTVAVLRWRDTNIHNFEDGPRSEVFPPVFPVPPSGSVLNLETLGLSEDAMTLIRHAQGSTTLYFFDNPPNKALEVGSIIRVTQSARSLESCFEVMHIYTKTVAEITAEQGDFQRRNLENRASRTLAELEVVTVYELHEVLIGNGLIYINASGDS